MYTGTLTEHRRGKIGLGQEARKGPALLGLGGPVRNVWTSRPLGIRQYQ